MLFVLVALYSALTYALKLTRHYEFKSSLLDLGHFVQVLTTFIRSGVPLSSVNPPFTQQHFLGFHFSPAILVFAPLYAATPKPELLLLLEAVCFAATAIPLFYCGKATGRSDGESLVWSVLFLLNPLTLNAAVWDFHEASFAAFFVAAALWAFVAGRYLWLWVFLLMLLGCKEHYGLTVAAFGLLWAFERREILKGAALASFGIVALLGVLFVVMPLFRGSATHPMLVAADTHLNRYAWTALPKQAWPGAVLKVLMSPMSLSYLAFLLLPLVFCPLLSLPTLMLGSSDLAANLLSDSNITKSVFSYHSAPLIPIVVVAAMRGIARHPRLRSRRVLSFCVFATLVTGYAAAPLPLPGAFNFWEIGAVQLSPDPTVATIRDLIRGSTSISVQANVGAFFADRQRVVPFPYGTESAELVVLHDHYPYRDPTYTPFDAPYDVVDNEVFQSERERILRSPQFERLQSPDPWIVLKRR